MLKPFEELRALEAHFTLLLMWPCNEPFLASNPNVLAYLAPLCIRHIHTFGNKYSLILTLTSKNYYLPEYIHIHQRADRMKITVTEN